MLIGRRWLSVKDCVLISTRIPSVARRGVLACLRSLDAETLARYPEREPVEHEAADFLGLKAAQVNCSRMEWTRRFICYVLPISIPATKRSRRSNFRHVCDIRTGRRCSPGPGPCRQNFVFPLEGVLSRLSARTRLSPSPIQTIRPERPWHARCRCGSLEIGASSGGTGGRSLF